MICGVAADDNCASACLLWQSDNGSPTKQQTPTVRLSKLEALRRMPS